MAIFNNTARLTYRSVLPPGTTADAAIAQLRDHDFVIRLDRALEKYTIDDSPAHSKTETKYYTITDRMEALPAGLWGTSVTFTAEITDIPSGCQWHIKAPLGLIQNTSLKIEPASDPEEGFCLVEEIEVTGSRLLTGTVISKISGESPGRHKRFADGLTRNESKD